MTVMDKALKIVGLTHEDYVERGFYKRSGRKAAAALRQMGYTQERMKTMASGEYATRWTKDGVWASHDYRPAFDVLCMAIGEEQRRTNG